MTAHRIKTPLTTGAAAVLLVFLAGCSTAHPLSAVSHDSVTTVASVDAASVTTVASVDAAEVLAELAVARTVSATYQRVTRAEADGYALPPTPAPLHECIAATDGHGAMGLHYIAAANLDAELDPAFPEVLVYEPTKHGRLRLVALEYVVFEDAWKADHGDTTPRLFGRDLTYVGVGNRYELPPFFQIHAWVWKHNPDGMFADHNRRVTCTNHPD